jgi:hypothetical protein
MSRRSEILNRLATLLSGIPDVGFDRNRQDDVEADEFPMLVMHDGSESMDPPAGQRGKRPFLRRTMSPKIAAFVGSDYDINDLYEQILAAIEADKQLNALLDQTAPIGADFDSNYPIENILHAGFVLSLELTYIAA